jgi:hypothetical protein
MAAAVEAERHAQVPQQRPGNGEKTCLASSVEEQLHPAASLLKAGILL